MSISIDHPTAIERQLGVESTVSLTVDRGLKSGKLDSVPLTENDLLRLIDQASNVLLILKGIR